ncbi:hypothetical protein OOT46_22975 [Aquabacterium sp. A7-Y]|uniref:hypothetical protein n=1 Tax=Aquabacterium sp. A7-Y TaxID=1349605 RepID=UPI00223E59B6|nr:hypothetical protein [Aquabacterium sp. A7-Y]MCW7540686.1 hypothetical protein [Aquabacterium sp. A7-Y]
MSTAEHSGCGWAFPRALLLGVLGAHANAQVPADPLQGYRSLTAQYAEAAPGRQVLTRYVVREGKLKSIGGVNRDLLVQTQHLCVEGKGVGRKIEANALPPYLSVLREEEYLSEAAKLTVQTQARLEVGLNDCSVRWKTSRRGTLGRWSKGTCMLDFDKRTFAGRCEGAEKPTAARGGDEEVAAAAATATSEQRTVHGQRCVVMAHPAPGELMAGAQSCYWLPAEAEKKRLPGLLSRPLALEVDFGRDNGRVSATELNEGKLMDARLFAIPLGFSRGQR